MEDAHRAGGAGGRQRSILLVAYYYPPCTAVGAHRPAAMAKYLERLGHDVTVLTTSLYDRDGRPSGPGEVVRTMDLRQLRRHLHGSSRGRDATEGGASGAAPPASGSARSLLRGPVWVPDRMAVAWAPFALRAALALHRSRAFDAVITTSPPESVHLVGRALAARGCAWVADLRDGWTFESWRRFQARLQRRLDEGLERRMLEAADVVTCVTSPVAVDLRRRTRAESLVVSHGFDPELLAAAGEHGESAAEAKLDPGRVSIVYTGRLGAVERDLGPLLQALRELAAQERDVAERLELAIAGPVRREERELLRMDLAPLRVTSFGPVSHRDALALQQAADVLLVLGSRRSHVANLKLYEYIGSGTPILAIGEGGEAIRIVAETGGDVVPGDAEAIKRALRRAASGAGAPPDGAEAFAYPAPAKRMSDAIEVAIARSRRRRPTRQTVRPSSDAAAAGDHPAPLRLRRLDGNPMVIPAMLPRAGGSNISGPSLLRAPDWLGETMGRYWLYFAHHHGDYIRLAYADKIDGPWRIHRDGTLRLDQVPGAVRHVASPDVHADAERERIRMYFHAPTRAGVQRTFVATSADGLAFEPLAKPLGMPYFRAFQWKGNWFAVSRGGDLYRSEDGLDDFEPGPNPFAGPGEFDSIRHVAVDVSADALWVYFSRVGDSPERILRTRIDLGADWTDWTSAMPPQEVLAPERPYEGSELPGGPSEAGAAPRPEKAVRDPAIFREAGRTYLVYSVAGESGLAIAELTESG